jgi:hypothetical protein
MRSLVDSTRARVILGVVARVAGGGFDGLNRLEGSLVFLLRDQRLDVLPSHGFFP